MVQVLVCGSSAQTPRRETAHLVVGRAVPVGGDVMTLFPNADGMYLRVRTTTGLHILPAPIVTAARPTRIFTGVVSPTRILEIQSWSTAFPAFDNLSFSAA